MACDGTTFLIMAIGILIPFTAFGRSIGLTALPLSYFLADWNFTLLLHFDADREELVYQEVCALVIALSVYLAN